MSVLTDKQTRNYTYVSRYSSIPFYYNTRDGKYVSGITKQLSSDIVYASHKVSRGDTLDSLADKYYGRPDLFWVVADFNRIQDPYRELFGNFTELKIPAITLITYN